MDGRNLSISKGMLILKALLFSYLITALSLLILTVLLYKFELGEGQITAGIVIVYITSCFLGGFFLGKKEINRKFIWGMLLGAVYFGILLLLSLILEPGEMAPVKNMVTSFSVCLGSGMLGGMLSGT